MQPLAPALLSTLAAPVLWAAGPMPAAAPITVAPVNYRTLRPELETVLARCTAPSDLLACSNADQTLQELIRISERPLQRLKRPRCLGSLSQLHSHLSVFRWGYQSRQRLQQQIDQTLAHCPRVITP